MIIKDIDAFQIFDSRGNPTLEAVVQLDNGICGHGLVPSGASTGSHEAWELRDGDPARFGGQSVDEAIRHVREIIGPALAGRKSDQQADVDEAMLEMDGTPNKSRLGANAILGVSMAVATAAAQSRGEPLHQYLGQGRGTLLPLPEIQIFGGGKHAQGRIDIQDFMVVATGAKSYPHTLEITYNVFQSAGSLLKEHGLLAGVADEGGYWPSFDRNEVGLELLTEAIRRAGYEPGTEAAISLDIAATDLFRDGRYHLGLEDKAYSSREFAELLDSWRKSYPIISVEDPMAEDDWDGWALVHKMMADKVQLIGDDLFTTNPARIRQGMDRHVANAVLIKLNQIGTVTETMEAIRLTQEAGWQPVISARSGETEDSFIAHLAVATNAGQLKVGSFCRSERMAKWNEVLRIERQLGKRARFEGANVFPQPGGN